MNNSKSNFKNVFRNRKLWFGRCKYWLVGSCQPLTKGIGLAFGVVAFFMLSIVLLVVAVIVSLLKGLRTNSLRVALVTFLNFLFGLLAFVFGVVFFVIAFALFHLKFSVLSLFLGAISMAVLLAFLLGSAARFILFRFLVKLESLKIVADYLNRTALLLQHYFKK